MSEILGTYPCGVPAAGPLREDAIIVGKSKLVRPVAVTEPRWTPGWRIRIAMKTTCGILMQIMFDGSTKDEMRAAKDSRKSL